MSAKLFIPLLLALLLWTAPARAEDAATLAALTERAEHKDVAAQFLLAWRYYKGIGAPQNEVIAARWMTKAAQGGRADAQYYLGIMYEYGQGVGADFGAARKWLLKSADQKNGRAQAAVGWLYVNGWGVKTDLQEACSWFMEASLTDKLPDAPNCNQVSARLTPGQIGAAREKAQNRYLEGKSPQEKKAFKDEG